MHFKLIDAVLERGEGRIVTLKHVSSAEEYLQDHFPTFPVLPGVMMLEAMVQAGRELLAGDPHRPPLVLGRVRALKYGRFVRPGCSLRVEVDLVKSQGGEHDLKGRAVVVEPGGDAGGSVAASGRFMLRGARVG